MGDFNEVYVILYKDSEGTIKPVLNDEGGMRLFMTFTKAYNVSNELSKKTGITHYPHSFQIDRVLFE